MGNLERLTGSPWHIEKMTRQEGDAKRHKSRCIHFKGKESNQCKIYGGRCHGSAHCTYYKESQINPATEVIDDTKTEKVNKNRLVCNSVEEFKGIRNLKLDEVCISKAFRSVHPSISKVEKVENFFKENGRLDKPIIVVIKNNKYYLEDGYLRYVVAKNNHIKEIPCEMGTSEEIKIYKKLRTINSLVWIKRSNEVGKVIEYSLEQVRIELDSGKTVLYDIHKAVDTKSIRIL